MRCRTASCIRRNDAMKLGRRSAMLGALAACAAPVLAEDDLGAIERRTGGRLGVAVIDTANGRRLAHRADERFPMCSTFKVLLATMVLKRIDAGEEQPDRIITYGKKDLLAYAPVTTQHVGEGGMSVLNLCAAIITMSDNTAADLLLGNVGGPAGWTRFARSLGDGVSRQDRTEPDANTCIPGDPRDTTTPAAMMANLQKVLLGDVLSAPSRDRLERWMIAGAIGKRRLRGGIPPDWTVADKPGTGNYGTCNDIAILRPPKRAPIVAAVYVTDSGASYAAQEGAIADVGRLISVL
ncbi:MAG: class A beta-lactamase [Alphaproteobacteria bacterium]|nr:class A beta-lactamase [Alphaproteobacteria bacterium]